MELLGKLGIDYRLLVAQIVNFGILLWILTRFVYRPVIARIESDEEELRRAREEQRKLEEERGSFEERKTREIAQAKERSREIIQETEEIAQEMRRQTQEEVEHEKRAVIRQIKSRLADIEHHG